jgi:hypothetical protein
MAPDVTASGGGNTWEGMAVLTRTMMESREGATTMPTRPTEVVDVEEWLDRAANPVRGFTPDVGAYVPRHRKEPLES